MRSFPLPIPFVRATLRWTPRLVAVCATILMLTQCSSPKNLARGTNLVVSVEDQKMGLYRDGKLVKSYKISTSKFGLGDRQGSNCTPLGKHEVVAKIGHGLPKGAVLKSRRWNGEVVKPNAPGRDPIVSRILWLGGRESHNRNAYGRCIYIHGTAEEHRLGSAASYGCVRMAAKDVIDVFDKVGVGTQVMITTNDLPRRATQEVTKPTYQPNAAPLPLQQAIPIEVMPTGKHNFAKDNRRIIGPPAPNRPA